MAKKNKIILVLSIIVILVSLTLSTMMIIKKTHEEEIPTIEGINLPENREILKDSKINQMDITDISLLTREGISTYKAKVTNNTDKEISTNNLYVIFHQDKEEIKILALKNTKIKPSNTIYINITSESDLSKTKKIEYITE